MADGSVVIGVSLDASSFAAQAVSLETQISQLGTRMNAVLAQSFAGDGLASSLTGALMSVTETVNSMAANLVSSMSTAAASAIREFTNAGWSAAGASAMSALTGGINSGGSAVSGAAKNVAGQAYSAFSSGGWSSIGANMMNGIASGILSAGASVVAAIRKVSADAELAAKDYYRISSPSGLMRDEVGVMISRGIAEGILDGASFVGGAMSALYGSGSLPSSGASGSAFPENPEGGRSVTQNIYLRDSDTSPYRTAKRIRRESEAIFR